jgi:hypothetical protein
LPHTAAVVEGSATNDTECHKALEFGALWHACLYPLELLRPPRGWVLSVPMSFVTENMSHLSRRSSDGSLLVSLLAGQTVLGRG